MKKPNENKIADPSKIRAIFFDVDGTILSHTQNRIPVSTLYALKELRKKGVLLFLSTGRHLKELEDLKVIDAFDFDGYNLLTGAMQLDHDLNVLRTDPIKGRDKEILIDFYKNNRLPLMFVNAKGIALNFPNEDVYKAQYSVHSPVPEPSAYKGQEILQVNLFGQEKDVEPLTKKLKDVEITRWNDYGYDASAKGCTKATGMQYLLDTYGISKDEIIAIGDGDNDLEMIEFAPLSIAMRNGSKKLQKLADLVAEDIDQDGLARILADLHLIEPWQKGEMKQPA